MFFYIAFYDLQWLYMISHDQAHILITPIRDKKKVTARRLPNIPKQMPPYPTPRMEKFKKIWKPLRVHHQGHNPHADGAGDKRGARVQEHST